MAESDPASRVWKRFIENLQLVIEQIQGEEEREISSEKFDANLYWKRLGDVFKALSHEATKLCLAYSSPPLPDVKACQSLQASVEKVILAMVSLFYTLPKTQGLTLKRALRKAVRQSVTAVTSLVENIHNYGAGSTEQRQSTGIVWEEADRFTALPKDNKSALIAVIEVNSPLVNDALQEMEEAMNTDEDDGLDEFLGITHSSTTDSWSESDRKLLGFGLGLMKCTKSVLKKTRCAVKENGSCTTGPNIAEMDGLAEHVERLSPAVDELVSSLYPPLQLSVVCLNAQKLQQMNSDLLNFVKHSHMTGEADEKWVEFLLKVNQHNYSNIESLTSGT